MVKLNQFLHLYWLHLIALYDLDKVLNLYSFLYDEDVNYLNFYQSNTESR